MDLSDFAAAGLNVHGVADPAAWDELAGPARRTAALLPGTRAILVLGSGGPALWDAFVADLRACPDHLLGEPHPLDAFVRRTTERIDAAWEAGPLQGVPRRWFYAAADAEPALDFRVLAHLAGLGGASRMGLLLHPVHGLWLGLRAACFLAVDLPAATPVTDDPCAGCPGPCATACPGGAFPRGRWQVDPCAAFHTASDACADTCHARLACPRGEGSRYSPEQRRYHYDRAAGRAHLRCLVGATGGAAVDAYDGVGPHWGTWRAKVDVRGA